LCTALELRRPRPRRVRPARQHPPAQAEPLRPAPASARPAAATPRVPVLPRRGDGGGSGGSGRGCADQASGCQGARRPEESTVAPPPGLLPGLARIWAKLGAAPRGGSPTASQGQAPEAASPPPRPASGLGDGRRRGRGARPQEDGALGTHGHVSVHRYVHYASRAPRGHEDQRRAGWPQGDTRHAAHPGHGPRGPGGLAVQHRGRSQARAEGVPRQVSARAGDQFHQAGEVLRRAEDEDLVGAPTWEGRGL
ncbi:unnamed protein product, partial [Prorocentrum cordatum]